MVTSDWGAIYKELGARPVVNATGSVTLLGGSTPLPEVKEAMDRADSAFIPLIDLEKAAGDEIARLCGVPAAYITSGAGSALTLASAAYMAGTDDDLIQQLPDTTGLKNEIVLQHREQYWYDRCLQLAGAKLVFAGDENGTNEDDIRAAITDKTCAIHVPVVEQAPKDPNVVPLDKVIEIAKEAGVYASVDAAGQIFPLENFGKYVRMGADFQCIAAKYMGAPQSTGLALGTEEIIDAISRHSFVGYESRRIRGVGRPHKVDRQEMMGCITAVQRWFKLDHESRLAAAEQESLEIIKPLRGIPGVTTELIDNIIAHMPFGVTVGVDEDVVGFNNEDLVVKLKEMDPPVWTRTMDNAPLAIHVFGLNPGEARLVGESIAAAVQG
jgi:L-seryl-tRNA(Ser) seleniumtransferase